MIDWFGHALNRIPIRARLTFWYIFLMALTFTLAGSYLLLRFQSSLLQSIDSSLQLAVSQSLTSIEDETDIMPCFVPMTILVMSARLRPNKKSMR